MNEQDNTEIEQTWLQKNESKIMLGLIGFAVLALIIVIGFYTFKFHQNIWVTKPEELGTFGDFIGGILNPIFAFLAFLILMMSFRLQSKELKKTGEELAKASEAQVLQAELTKKQIEQIDIQNFENLFFKLIDMSIHLRNRVKMPEELFDMDNQVIVLGKKIREVDDKIIYLQKRFTDNEKYYFKNKNYYPEREGLLFQLRRSRKMKSMLEERLHEINGIIRYLAIQNRRDLELIIDVFELQVQESTWEQYIRSGIAIGFNEYLRINYQILDLISTSLDFKTGKRYAEIYKAQLMDYELAALFWGTKNSKKYEKLKILIEKFTILEFLSFSENQHGLNCRIDSKDEFNVNAFKSL